jgi:endonuclease YncB( thermonuclease family)
LHELPTTIPGPSETLFEEVCGGIAIAGIDRERRRVAGLFFGPWQAAHGERVQQGTLRAWGKQGGRPGKPDRKARARLRKLLASGKSQTECAAILGVSVRTVGRVVARFKASDDQF